MVLTANNKKDFMLEFSSFLLKSNSLRFGVFTLASGKQSSYYIDLRVLPSFPSHFRLAIGALKDAVAKKVGEFDTLASVPTSGLVFGSALIVCSYEARCDAKNASHWSN